MRLQLLSISFLEQFLRYLVAPCDLRPGRLLCSSSRAVYRSSHSPTASIQYLGADRRGSTILVPWESLNGANIVSLLEQMPGEQVPAGVGGLRLDQACLFIDLLERRLEDRLTHLVPISFAVSLIIDAILFH